MSALKAGTVARRRLRRRLVARDGLRCFYCRKGFGNLHRQATFDHYLPRSLGGPGGTYNLVLACEPCNTRKGARLPYPLALLLLHRFGRAVMP
jgi:5-methylcytosine-specific restriction endonuclease McrA